MSPHTGAHCGVCQHHPGCKWQDVANFETDGLMLSASFIKGRAHGREKAAKAPSGRKVKDAPSRKFVVEETVAYRGDLSQAEMSKAILNHFEALPIKDSLLVRCKPHKPTKERDQLAFSNAKPISSEARGQVRLAWKLARMGNGSSVCVTKVLTTTLLTAALLDSHMGPKASSETLRTERHQVDFARSARSQRCPSIETWCLSWFR